MESNWNNLIAVCLFLATLMCKPVEGYVLYIWFLLQITHSTYAYVCSPSCLCIQFLRRMLLYPVWIYFPTLGGEGTFVRVGVKTEFIASWLPPRMRTVRMMGHREGPPHPTLPVGTFAAARKEEGAPHVAVTTGGCRTREK